ncbi:ABC transporter substrate-binding protein [Clostridium formicaceticum]|uniref:Iron ABC transporter substrate-binding protein n=1 Tax=Clostridium formicaceticum TaxID=1497 RepID=A0AAC9RP34_9CLOT|nr:ABC transporter substrate-binding protein [Clostridium formicaceticum]AOY77797.1 iron ABC transporter substrate-binding protein [Clostridium formicaceticum]ARE88403.1 hypothetical protein CLFO_28060 [Clostridium formicaceticum]
MKINDIRLNSKIKDIIEQYPETLSVFAANGFNASTKESLLEMLGESMMLVTALKVKGVNQELFIKMLEEQIAEKANITQEQDEDVAQKLNFVGYTYCPLKLTFRECFEEVLKKYVSDTGDKDFKYYVPSGCSSEDPYENLWKADHINQLPEVIASVGFRDFFRKEFVEKFVNKGYFKAVPQPKVHKALVSAGLIDRDGWYTVYSVFPLVMLIDKKKLGKLPVPKQWSDLLHPIYADNIIIGASHGDIHEDLLLYIYKDHGEEGLVKLAANIKAGWHASQMAKTAGTNSSEGAAVYVIPWMFAKSCPRTETTEIIWPIDGALTTPIYTLVKESAMEKYKPFIDFLIGFDYGQRSADNYFPVSNAEVDNKLPVEASFKWLGWDYIKSHSMEELKEYVVGIFQQHWEKKTEMKEMA